MTWFWDWWLLIRGGLDKHYSTLAHCVFPVKFVRCPGRICNHRWRRLEYGVL